MIFIFKCKRCGTIHEFKFPIGKEHDLSSKQCGKCGLVGQFDRVFTKPQIVYKAGGFASTSKIDEERKWGEYRIPRKD